MQGTWHHFALIFYFFKKKSRHAKICVFALSFFDQRYGDLRIVHNLFEFLQYLSDIMITEYFIHSNRKDYRNMKQKLASFFYGRYGADALAKGMLAVYVALAVVMLFVGTTAKIIINFISLILCFLMFYRMLSKNIAKRTQENQTYLHIRKKIKEWFLLCRNKWKYRKTHVYKKCPYCGVQIRLPRVSGEHRCACPKCGDSFGISIK